MLANLVPLFFFQHDASLASPTDPADWIKGGKWDDVRGQAWSTVHALEGWAMVRRPR